MAGDPKKGNGKATATSIRVPSGKPLITDGPFAETREQLGGHFPIDVKNLDEALGVAARIPGARVATVEIPPVVEIPGPPAASCASLVSYL